MMFLREDTAGQIIMLGPFLDSVDGITPETGLTIANTDIRVQKSDVATFANKNSGGGTHVEDGYYQATFDATDTSAAGRLLVQINVAGAIPVWHEFMVLAQVLYDSLITGGDFLPVDVRAWLNSAPLALSSQRVVVDIGAVDGSATKAALLGLFAEAKIRATGVATAGAASAITLAGGESATDDIFNDDMIVLVSGTGAGQVRKATDYVGGTKVLTVDHAWQINPDATTGYALIAAARVNIAEWIGAVVNALVSGRVDASVGAMAANVLTATAIASNAFTAAKFAADFLTSSGLATSAAEEIRDSVWNLADAEETAVPAANAAFRDKVNFVFALARNKIEQTTTLFTLRNDGDSGDIATAAVSDDGTTFTRDELA